MQILKVFILFLLIGCAHENKFNSSTCGKYTSRLFTAGGGYWLGGIVFQQGECSLLRPLKIEFGEIYSVNKSSLDFALASGGGSEFDNFATDIGCHIDSHNLFKQELLKNKDRIFGEKYSRSHRAVMLDVYTMIRENKELSELCWK